MNITQALLPTGQYISTGSTVKSQIVLHHTCSNPVSITGDKTWWESTPERVATHFIVSATGEIFQLVPLDAWAYSLGLNNIHRDTIEKRLISIEIDSWGALTYDFKQKSYKSWTGEVIPKNEICVLSAPYRNVRYFQKYTAAQILAVENLINWLSQELNIHGDFNVENMFQVNQKALTGANVLTSHASFRQDKTDIYPQPEMVKMLKRLKLQK